MQRIDRRRIEIEMFVEASRSLILGMNHPRALTSMERGLYERCGVLERHPQCCTRHDLLETAGKNLPNCQIRGLIGSSFTAYRH
jgi:hypothetical protein